MLTVLIFSPTTARASIVRPSSRIVGAGLHCLGGCRLPLWATCRPARSASCARAPRRCRGAPCRTGRGAGESNRCGGRGRSELVVALSLSLSFTSQRRSLCSARWRAQGWRGESDQKPLTKSGSPGCQVRRGGSKAIPSEWQAPGFAAIPPLLRSSLKPHRTLMFKFQGWLAESVFGAFGYLFRSIICLQVRRVPCAVINALVRRH